ncbi:MAG: pyruvate formate lyase family protein [Clostridia bacterium]
MSLVFDMMKNNYSMSPYARFLLKHNMKSTAVLYKNMNETLMRRSCRAVRFLLEETDLPNYDKGQVVFINHHYTSGNIMVEENKTMKVNLNGNLSFNAEEFEKIQTSSDYEAKIKKNIIDNAKNMSSLKSTVRYLNHGGHTSMNFEYVLKHGFNGYKELINKKLESLEDLQAIDFQKGMLDLLIGIENFITRYTQKLKSIENPDKNLSRLISTLEVVPFNPPTTFYQAYITMYVTMFFGESIEPGRIDQLLLPFYQNDETVDRDETLFLIRELFSDIEKRMNHPGTTHVTIGGSKADDSPAYNELTELCVIAIRGLRAPNISLCMRDDMPQKLWDLTLYNYKKGYAQPALVADKLYIDGFTKKYGIPKEDAVKYAFGGCAEVLIQGKTCCDSIWAGLNMLDVFEDAMYNELMNCETFEEFYSILKNYIRVSINDMVAQSNMRQHDYALHQTLPLKTLFVDGCIENSLGFTAGGAKYNFSCADFFGSSNIFNALYTIKKYYQGELGDISKEDFLNCFINNYKGNEKLHLKILSLPKYGNFNEEINDIAHDLMTQAFDEVTKLRGYRGDTLYLPTMIFWIYWILNGENVGATPDGRFAFEPLANSIGASVGTDKEGPTAALGAALSVPQEECLGTAVFNLYLDGSNFETKEKQDKVKMLIKTYLLGGGCQVQVNVVDKKTLQDAIVHPEKHEDIIVRVGGFSDNFVHLSDEIKQEVLSRNEL